MKRTKTILQTIGIILICLIGLSAISFNKALQVERDQYGNDTRILKIKVIMGDENVRTVEELIQDYDYAYH